MNFMVLNKQAYGSSFAKKPIITKIMFANDPPESKRNILHSDHGHIHDIWTFQ